MRLHFWMARALGPGAQTVALMEEKDMVWGLLGLARALKRLANTFIYIARGASPFLDGLSAGESGLGCQACGSKGHGLGPACREAGGREQQAKVKCCLCSRVEETPSKVKCSSCCS